MNISSRSFSQNFQLAIFWALFLCFSTPGASFGSGDEKGVKGKTTSSGLELRNVKARAEVEKLRGKALSIATFAGGCFWCMEPPFEKRDGVAGVVSGYMGDPKQKEPSYGSVSSGKTKYLEVVQVFYDPKKISYVDLLEIFWRNVDPTQDNGQFVDKGPQYRTAIFYHSKAQKRHSGRTKKKLGKDSPFKGKKIVTEIRKATKFYPAEDYHQDYYKTNTAHYKLYRRGSGRDTFLEKTWGARNTANSPTSKKN